MSKLCPECGEPPHYHSFCTLCAQLFRRPSKEWERRLALLERKIIRRVARDARDAEFRRAYQVCESSQQLAAHLGRSITWTNWRRAELKLPVYPAPRERRRRRCDWTEAEDSKLAVAIANGKLATETAAIVGRTVSAVKNRRGNLGLPPFKYPDRKRKDPRAELVARLRRAGLTYLQVAVKLGVTRNAIAGIVQRHRQHAEAGA